jgi:hypothetical protein
MRLATEVSVDSSRPALTASDDLLLRLQSQIAHDGEGAGDGVVNCWRWRDVNSAVFRIPEWLGASVLIRAINRLTSRCANILFGPCDEVGLSIKHCFTTKALLARAGAIGSESREPAIAAAPISVF